MWNMERRPILPPRTNARVVGDAMTVGTCGWHYTWLLDFSPSRRVCSCCCSLLKQSWVLLLLMKQPFYISGIENVENAKVSAIGAIFLWLVSFGCSIAYLIHEAQRRVRDGVRSGTGGGSSVGSASHHSAASLTELFARTPLPALGGGGILFHDYDPVDTTDDSDRGVMA